MDDDEKHTLGNAEGIAGMNRFVQSLILRSLLANLTTEALPSNGPKMLKAPTSCMLVVQQANNPINTQRPDQSGNAQIVLFINVPDRKDRNAHGSMTRNASITSSINTCAHVSRLYKPATCVCCHSEL